MKKSILALIFLMALSTMSWATISRVGSSSYTLSSGSGTWTHTLAQAPTSGDLLVVAVATQDGCGNTTTVTVTDSASNALTKAASNTGNGGSFAMDVYIMYEIAPSGLTTSLSITTTISGGGGCSNPYPAASAAEEYSGAAATVDTTATGASGFSDAIVTWNTSSVSATANDLLIGAVSEGSGQTGISWTTGTGWNQLQIQSANPSIALADQINVSAGSYSYNGTWNTTGSQGTRINSVFSSFLAGSTPPPSPTKGGIVSNGIIKGGII